MIDQSILESQVSKTYDNGGNLTKVEYPNEPGGAGRTSIVYGYDALSRVNVVEESSGTVSSGIVYPTASNSDDIANYAFYGPGRHYLRAYNPSVGSFVTTEYSYDAGRRVTEIEHANVTVSGTPQSLTFQYLYDREGAVIAEDATHEYGTRGLDVYGYDSAYRLIEESRDVSSYSPPSSNTAPNPTLPSTFGYQRRWKLDGVTNWRDVTIDTGGGAATTSRSINGVNEYTSVGGTGQTYDDNGCLTDDGTFEFVYDALNRVVRVEDSNTSATISTMRWDAKSRRVRNDAGTEENFYYLGSKLVEEVDSSGNATAQFVLGGAGERVRSEFYNITGTTCYYLQKLNGSVVGLYCKPFSFGSWGLTSYYDYDSQGAAQLQQVGTDATYFTADDTFTTSGLSDYLWQEARYDAATGRLLPDGWIRFMNTFNGRKDQPSTDMWRSSPWGLRYNQDSTGPPKNDDEDCIDWDSLRDPTKGRIVFAVRDMFLGGVFGAKHSFVYIDSPGKSLISGSGAPEYYFDKAIDRRLEGSFEPFGRIRAGYQSASGAGPATPGHTGGGRALETLRSTSEVDYGVALEIRDAFFRRGARQIDQPRGTGTVRSGDVEFFTCRNEAGHYVRPSPHHVDILMNTVREINRANVPYLPFVVVNRYHRTNNRALNSNTVARLLWYKLGCSSTRGARNISGLGWFYARGIDDAALETLRDKVSWANPPPYKP